MCLRRCLPHAPRRRPARLPAFLLDAILGRCCRCGMSICLLIRHARLLRMRHMPLPPPTALSLDPVVLFVLVLLLGGYFAAVGPLRRACGAEPVAQRRIASFVAGWLILTVTLVSPLDTLGRYYLFAAHTLQLLVLTTLSAPLL